MLTIFSVGYAAMAAKVSTVGGFYSFISQGLGREVGMSAGITSLACYSIFEASLTGLFAFFGNSWLSTHLGINVPWLVLALVHDRGDRRSWPIATSSFRRSFSALRSSSKC